jgi:amino acid adenylation domain-containing protein
VTEEYVQAKETGLEVAVTGMAARFPGAENIDEFWENLKNGIESISFFTDEELKAVGFDPVFLENPSFVKARGCLDDIGYFDAGFFGFTPREAEFMDPQVRFLHECAWEALEDAGCDPETYEGLIGVYFGASDNFQWRSLASWAVEMAAGTVGSQFTGNLLSNKDLLCSRLSYQLNLTGPSAAVYSACSTSLLAIHKACRELLGGECDMALAGGVSIAIPREQGYFYEAGMIESPDGHCRAFDIQANGTVFGSGIGVVVLQRLDDAEEAGNHIYAVIKGSAVNNDGKRKVGYTAPSVEGQADVIRAAYQVAEVDPDSIGCIETHGTGTALGDPIEIKALVQGMNRTSDNNNPCPIGAVKTNIGHLDAAAGAAGFIKIVLCLKHGLIPPTLHFTSPNPELHMEKIPFYVNHRLMEWGRVNNRTRRAGVSSFGIGGTNVHVVLEEWRGVRRSDGPRRGGPPCPPSALDEYQLILVSAKTAPALDKISQNLAEHLKNHPELDLADVAYTLQKGRKAFVHRKALVCATGEEAIETLSKPDSPLVQRLVSNEEFQHTVFMFAGQGGQYVNMGLELYKNEPVFREAMDRCFEILTPMLGVPIKEILYPPATDNLQPAPDINQTEITQPVIFVFEYALASLLMSWGINPDAMIGYSFGEYTAACLAGVFSLEDALSLVVLRGQLVQELPIGAMLSVPLPEEELRPLLDDGLSIAIVNEPACIVAGEIEAIERFEGKMKRQRLMCVRVNVNLAFHTSIMDEAVGIFEERLEQVRRHEPQVPYISGITGDWVTAEEAVDHRYWIRHLRETIRFSRGIQRLLKEKRSIFIEIGPGRDLTVLVKRYIDHDAPQPVINLIRPSRKEVSDVGYLLRQMGRLWLYRQKINWKTFHSGSNEKRYLVPLPGYPFERQHYWPDLRSVSGTGGDNRTGQPVRKSDITDWFYYPSWKRSHPVDYDDFVLKRSFHGVCLIFSGDCGGCAPGTALAGKLRQSGTDIVLVKAGSGFNREDAHHYSLDPREAPHFDRLLEELGNEKRVPRWIVHLWNVTEEKEPVELTAEKLENARYTGFYSLVYLARAIGGRDIDETVQILVISNHMQDVMGEDLRCPEKALLLGPVRVIPHEYANIRCRSVDIVLPPPGSRQEQRLVRQLVMEMKPGVDTGEEVIAYRSNQRWVQTFEPVPLKKIQEEAETAYLREKGVYLLTGGLGGIGLVLAEHLARQVKAKLILTGRSGLDPLSPDKNRFNSISRKVQEIEGMGAEVLILAADAADQEQMAAVIRRAKERFGSINGVIHSAGIIDYGGVIQGRHKKEKAAMSESVLAAKLEGTLLLERLLKQAGMCPDFIVLCSSIASLMPLFGQVAYSAANNFLDAYAHYRNRYSPFADGKPASDQIGKESPVPVRSINWSAWQQVGMAIEVVKRSGGDPDTDLKDLILPPEGVEVFNRFMNTRLSRVAVSPWDLKKLIGQAQRVKEGIQEIKPRHMEMRQETRKQPLHRRPELDTPYTPPGNESQQKLAFIWQRFFGLEQVGIDDDFFDLGGDSLKAMVVAFDIQREFNVNVTLVEFFKRCTIRKLDEYISGAADDRRDYSAIPSAEQKEYYPLSPAQKRLFILQQMEAKNIVYNETSIVELEKGLDMRRLEDTFRKLISRHESLRTSFLMIDDEPVQRVLSHVEFEIEYYSATGDTEDTEKKKQKAIEIVQNQKLPTDFVRYFDLSSPPLVRAALIETGKEKHILVVDMHHIIVDGRSQEIFAREFAGLYTGNEFPLLRIQYRDFVQWLTGNRTRASIKKQEAYWLKEFAGDIPCLDLPLDYDRPRVQGFEGSLIRFSMGSAETRALKQLASRENVTLFMLLLALFNVLLSRLGGQEDVVVGTLIAGREHADLQPVMGMFANTLALRNFPGSQLEFSGFLNHLKKRTLEAFENQDYPYEELVEHVVKARDSGRNPLFDVVFTFQSFQPAASGPTARTGVTGEEPYESGTARFDLLLTAVETGKDLAFKLDYCTRLFKEESIQRFIGYFKKLVSSLIENPSQKISAVETITEKEKERILVDFNDTPRDYPRERTIDRLFADQAEKRPDGVSVVGSWRLAVGKEKRSGETGHLTYGELNKRSDQVGRLLQERGVQNDTMVGIEVEPSLETIIGILGILKAGGAYLPIETDYPGERKKYMLADSSTPIVLNFEHLNFEFLNGCPSLGLSNLSSSNLAYIIYTSGSTGRPKGVMVEHRNVVRLVKNTDYIRFQEKDRILQAGALAFDASTFEIWGALLNGLTLYLAGKDQIPAPQKLKNTIKRYEISTMWMTSSLFNHMVNEDIEIFRTLRNLLVGGDVLSPHRINRVKRKFPHLTVINGYGPTENTTFSTTFRIDKEYDRGIPIGKPIANSTAYIFDKAGHPVPIGVYGELVVGGDGVSRGYLNNPELTAEKFLNYRSYRTYRSYKTGDLARWLPDGNIEFSGRLDRQVKIRGFRIELEEIESRLEKLDEVKEAAAAVKEDKTGDKYLCAYVVTAGDIEVIEMKRHLAGELPDYSIPSYFVKLEYLPLTASGKVDMKALPDPGEGMSGAVYAAPRDEIEKKLVKIWSEVLGFGDKSPIVIGIDDNFFELGGHSLKATILAAKIHKAFDIKIPLVEIFRTSTIKGLAAYIKDAEKDIYQAIRPTENKEYYPQSSAQKRLFFLDKFENIGTSYNIPMVLEFNEKPDLETYRHIFSTLIAHHETLRTSFHLIDNEPVQRVHKAEYLSFAIEYYEAGAQDAGRINVETVIRDFLRPFDLAKPPLLRLGILETGPPDPRYLVLFDIHHIVGDGTSMGVLTGEFIRLYEGRPLSPMRIQYRDFTAWQINLFESGKINEQETYWMNRYPEPGQIPRLNLPTDYPRPEVLSFAGDNYNFVLGPGETAAIKEMMNRYDATLYIYMTTLFNILLHKYSGQEDIIVGGGIAGRPHEDLRELIGMFVNMLPIRNQPQPHKTFREFLNEVRENCIDAFDNQDMQFEALVDRLNLERTPARNPMSDVSIVVQNFAGSPEQPGSLMFNPYKTQGESKTSKFDLTLFVYELEDGLYFNMEYSTDLFRRETVEKIANHFIEIVNQVLENQQTRLEDITVSYELTDAETDIFTGEESEFTF